MRLTVLITFLAVFVLTGAECTETERIAGEANIAAQDLPADTNLLGFVAAIAPVVPYGNIILLATTALGFLKSAKHKKAGINMAKAINSVKKEGVVDFNKQAVRDQLSREMGSFAKRLVDEAQGKKCSMSF